MNEIDKMIEKDQADESRRMARSVLLPNVYEDTVDNLRLFPIDVYNPKGWV